MKVAYDLHIHSALSPCGDNDMTPNNIVNMAFLKKLQVIAITDHNSMLNVLPTMEVAAKRGIVVVPGIEVNTKEEVHVLCYFPTIEEGMKFQDIIYNSLPNIDNREDLFGQQLVLDKDDKVIGDIKKMLLNSSEYSLEEILELVKEHKGVLVPAHVDRNSFSIISSLGFIPESLNIKAIEAYDLNKLSKFNKILELDKYKIIKNSDAHYLTHINEANHYLDLEATSISSVVDYLKDME